MSGQIPKYGKDFELVSTCWHPELAARVYRLRRDPRWFIRSRHGSKVWRIYSGDPEGIYDAHGRPQGSFIEAMNLLLDGIDYGFYEVADAEAAR